MNKRQKKKQYKKMHGFNPPNTNRTNKEELSNYIRILSKIIYGTIKKVKNIGESIKSTIQNTVESIKSSIQNIGAMSDEEFTENIKFLTKEQKEMAWRIRIIGKKDI